MTSPDQLVSLLGALTEYAPQVGPYCGKHSIYHLASAQNLDDKLSLLTDEACKANGSCSICRRGVAGNNGKIHVKWDVSLSPPGLRYQSSQILCGDCYMLTDLEEMTRLLASVDTMPECDQRFLSANGHAGQGTAQGLSLTNECYAIANAVRLQLRSVPLRLYSGSGEETDVNGTLKLVKSHLVKGTTPAKGPTKIKSQTPAPAKAAKADTKKRRRTME